MYGEDIMNFKQISVTMPEKLFRASKDYTQELGYRNLQEFILELLRNKVILERVARYKKIEDEMKSGKNVKRFKQTQASKFLKSL